MQVPTVIMAESSIVTTVLPLPPGFNQSYKIVSIPRRTTFRKGTRIYNDPNTPPAKVHKLGDTPAQQVFKQEALYALKDLKITSIDWSVIDAIKTSKRKVPLSITIKFFYPTLWKHDVDSGVKAVMDAIFNHIGLNDNLVVQLISKKFDDRENPRVEVALSCVIGR